MIRGCDSVTHTFSRAFVLCEGVINMFNKTASGAFVNLEQRKHVCLQNFTRTKDVHKILRYYIQSKEECQLTYIYIAKLRSNKYTNTHTVSNHISIHTLMCCTRSA